MSLGTEGIDLAWIVETTPTLIALLHFHFSNCFSIPFTPDKPGGVLYTHETLFTLRVQNTNTNPNLREYRFLSGATKNVTDCPLIGVANNGDIHFRLKSPKTVTIKIGIRIRAATTIE